ncbi:hypothetical protein [Agaribacterium haliotis]|uniref:hypothetical protein n=1 Tax=Agaribacterium haliotis TaxID=2013869 RepID=UPI000BB55D82|nr:hypothetical protein [Agaribacterium haliotis]
MKISSVLAVTLICSSLAACKLGFEAKDPDDKDQSIYSGPSEGKWWELTFTGSGNNYELRRRPSPSSSQTDFTLKGTMTRLDSGYAQFSVSSKTGSGDNVGSNFVALEFGNEAFVLYPVESGADELIAIVPKDKCPSNDVRGNGLFLERPEDNATSDSIAWLGSFTYGISDKSARLSDGLALDDDFTRQNDVSTSSADCEDGIAEHNNGNHFLADNSAVIELDAGENNYRRVFSLPARSINAIADSNGNYVGFARDFAAPDDVFYIRAECTDGQCSLYQVSDIENPEASTQLYYTLNFDDNLNVNNSAGLATGDITNHPVNGDPQNQSNIACSINTSFSSEVGSNTKNYQFLHCNAQSPYNRERLLHLVLLLES